MELTPEQRARLEDVARFYPFVRLRKDDLKDALARIDALEARVGQAERTAAALREALERVLEFREPVYHQVWMIARDALTPTKGEA